MRRSRTWDQGKEMAHYVRFTIAPGAQVYFCDPHKPLQRGSNENTNRLLRHTRGAGQAGRRCRHEQRGDEQHPRHGS